MISRSCNPRSVYWSRLVWVTNVAHNASLFLPYLLLCPANCWKFHESQAAVARNCSMLSTSATTIDEKLQNVDYIIIQEWQRESRGILTHLICSETIILCLHEGKAGGVRQLPLHGEGGRDISTWRAFCTGPISIKSSTLRVLGCFTRQPEDVSLVWGWDIFFSHQALLNGKAVDPFSIFQRKCLVFCYPRRILTWCIHPN